MQPSLGSIDVAPTWRHAAGQPQPRGGCRQRPGAAGHRRNPQRAERAIRRGASNQTGTVAHVPDGVEDRQLPIGRARTVVRRILSWYAEHARDLPWRRPDATPWAIMVSEFMLQQTPVERVRGPWQAWLERWPTPASLAAQPPGDAVRAWGRLGYPRRALRLHQAAQMIMNDFDGQVPEDRESLLRLPGVGSYTAAAIGSFAYGRREIVLDTNVRRLLTRLAWGVAYPSPAPTARERALAEELAPRITAARGALGRRLDGAWRFGVPRSQSHLRCLPRSDSVCVASGRLSGVGRGAAARSGRTWGPTGSAGAPYSRCSDPATSRSQDSELAEAWQDSGAASAARWPRSYRTGWWSPMATDGRCQARFLTPLIRRHLSHVRTRADPPTPQWC